jgi:hypothetical protein
MIIFAVDPGGTCGMAKASFTDGKADHFWSGEAPPMMALREIDEQAPEIDLLAYETFTPRPGVYTWQPDALYTIGAILYLSNRYGFATYGQSPADAKRFATTDKLEKMGWRNPTKGGHADDAARHLLLRAIRGGVLNADALV